MHDQTQSKDERHRTATDFERRGSKQRFSSRNVSRPRDSEAAASKAGFDALRPNCPSRDDSTPKRALCLALARDYTRVDTCLVSRCWPGANVSSLTPVLLFTRARSLIDEIGGNRTRNHRRELNRGRGTGFFACWSNRTSPCSVRLKRRRRCKKVRIAVAGYFDNTQATSTVAIRFIKACMTTQRSSDPVFVRA